MVTDKAVKLPYYAKATIIILGLFAFFTILYIAQGIIVPLIFATIIAVVLHPAVNFLIERKINRIIAIAIILFLTFLIIAAFSTLLLKQATQLSDSWPQLSAKVEALGNQTITDAAIFYDIDPQKIHAWIGKAKEELISMGSAAIGQTLVIIGNSLVILFLIPVYVFMILFYQPILRDFIKRLFSKSQQKEVGTMVTQIKFVIQRYLIGLIFEFIIVAVLNSLALLMLGVDYAILLGIIGALLNIIPYLGGIISVALYMIVALITKSPIYMLYVFAAYSFIQFIDNNYIVPKIVASKVKINALFSIIVVIAGNALWGISGMFLSIPILAIVKLIFDHIESLKPWGFLFGDTMPPLIEFKSIKKRLHPKSPNSGI